METAVLNINPSSDVELQGHYSEAVKLLEYARDREVQSLDDAKLANNDLSMIAQLKKTMDAKKMEYTRPLEQHKKDIIEAFRWLMEPILEADKITRDKVIAYKQAEAARQAEEERINAERLKLAQDEMALKGEITAPVDLIEVTETTKRVSTDLGTSSILKVRKWRVVDFSLLPDEFKIVDGGKITKLVKAGIGEIAGIEIYTEDSLQVKPR